MNDKCELCGQDCFEASARGAFLHRMNKGELPAIWQCRPSCETKTGDQNTALLAALEAGEND